MAFVSADGGSFVFDGQTIGGIIAWDVAQGRESNIVHRPIKSGVAYALPGQVDHGFCVFKLHRNKDDVGQQAMLSSLQNRTIKTCVITDKDGKVTTFQAFCVNLPIAGSINATNPVNAGVARLRISGGIVHT